MSKRIVLVDAFGYELFSGASVANEEEKNDPVVEVEDARQGGPLESGIFFTGASRRFRTTTPAAPGQRKAG